MSIQIFEFFVFKIFKYKLALQIKNLECLLLFIMHLFKQKEYQIFLYIILISLIIQMKLKI